MIYTSFRGVINGNPESSFYSDPKTKAANWRDCACVRRQRDSARDVSLETSNLADFFLGLLEC